MKSKQQKFEIKTKPLFKFRLPEGSNQSITHPTTTTIHTNTTVILHPPLNNENELRSSH